MKIRYYIPNTITALNLTCGLVSITRTMEGDLVTAALFILLATVFDFLDGSLARLLEAGSEFGRQLDSLADVVSFGVAPGIIVFNMLSVNCEGSCNILDRYAITPYFGLLLPLCAALRLAKFNVDPSQHDSFSGLPTPASAIFFASVTLVIFLSDRFYTLLPFDFLPELLSMNKVLAILAVFFSYLMISDYRMFALKFRTAGWMENRLQYLFLIGSALLIFVFSLSGLPLVILLYIIMSLGIQGKTA